MGVSVSVSPLTRRFALAPMQAGGYARNVQPDPNSAIATYRRGNGTAAEGAYVGGGTRSSALQPSVTASGESALSANLGLLQRARDTRQGYDAGEVDRRTQAGNTGLAAVQPLAIRPMDQRFDALLQALSERGVSKLSTGAAHFGGPTGFFDQQNPDAQAQDARRNQLAFSDLMDAMSRQKGRR